MAPDAIGSLLAQSVASSRSLHSSTMYPPICSFVSENGPSVTKASPSLAGRTVRASPAGPSRPVLTSTPALWSEDCVGYPPRDWPEPGPFRGRQELRDVFNSWNIAFGEDWTTHMTVRDIHDLGDGRVLLEFEFATSGVESGLPVDQELAS